MKGFIWTVVVIGIIVAVAYCLVVFAGLYPVGTGTWAPLAWTLDRTAMHSIHRRASSIQAVNVTDPAKLREGFAEYHQTCETCHGAPGVEEKDFAKQMDPEPPEPDDATNSMSPSEMFWTVKHGIQMTGMPAFGKLEPDEKLWAVVAVMRQLPHMTPEQYQQQVAAAPAEGDEQKGGS